MWRTKDAVSEFLKTVAGILAVALVISGLFIYLTKRQKTIFYDFDPDNAYVYTFDRGNFRLSYEGNPEKRVGLLSDGFNPLCLFGCWKDMEKGELSESLVREDPGRRGSGESNDPRFVYLKSGEYLNLEMDLGKGDSIQNRFPYLNRLILELEDEEDVEKINLKVFGYTFEDRGKNPEDPGMVEKGFTFSGDFGKSSVFALPHPYFVSRVQLSPAGEGKRAGIRNLSLYLERDDYVSKVSRAEEALPVEDRGSLKELEEKLENLQVLDPYSPDTDYLLAEVGSLLGDHEKATRKIDRAIRKLKDYSDFLVTRLDLNDLYEKKARIFEQLGDWEEAAGYMERAGPEVDYEFLSEVYLKGYKETGNSTDLNDSLLNAVLDYRDKPRLVLENLRKYSERTSYLEFGLKYFDNLVERNYRLEGGRRVSRYPVDLSWALLEIWLDGEGSIDRARERLDRAEELSDSTEKLALVNAARSRVLKAEGKIEEANRSKERSLEFFSDYSSMYDEWIEYLKE
ncbi:MAG: hypothetical protein ACOC86_00710 [Candidatus Bipolaricaulota bacterium]